MPKELFIGAKPLLKKSPFSWWPPKEFALYNVGQFDIYPNQFSQQKLQTLIGGHDIPYSKPVVDKINTGCVHIKGLYAINYQQVFANELRQMTINEPHKFKFNRVQDLSN